MKISIKNVMGKIIKLFLSKQEMEEDLEDLQKQNGTKVMDIKLVLKDFFFL